MTKMPKMQKIPNLLLLAGGDDQLAYFILLTPFRDINLGLGWDYNVKFD